MVAVEAGDAEGKGVAAGRAEGVVDEVLWFANRAGQDVAIDDGVVERVAAETPRNGCVAKLTYPRRGIRIIPIEANTAGSTIFTRVTVRNTHRAEDTGVVEEEVEIFALSAGDIGSAFKTVVGHKSTRLAFIVWVEVVDLLEGP